MGDIEFTLTRCKAIETLLVERFGATGRGLHEKISSVENLLPPNVVKQGRYIATIRNKITHDANYQTLDDRDRFIRACNEVEAALQNYQPGTQQNFNQGQQFFSENNREISVNLNEHFRTITNRSAILRNFVFYLEKNAFGIKILTRKGRLISIIFGRVIFAFIQLIVLGFILGAISENIQEFNFLAIALIGITVICFLTLLSIRSSLINITIAPNYIYVGRRKYERRGETIFYIFSENMNQPFSWKVYFIYPNKKVYLARRLTQLEAEELLKILCNADRMYREPQVTFSIKRKDGLIFLSSTKTNTSFVIDYNEGLWQGLRCRMKVNGQVELSKSELTEIYHKRLQTLS